MMGGMRLVFAATLIFLVVSLTYMIAIGLLQR